MKPIIVMKHTLAYILSEAQVENLLAIELLGKFETMNIVDNEKYLVLTDKIIEI
jgi:hypothetical protein